MIRMNPAFTGTSLLQLPYCNCTIYAYAYVVRVHHVHMFVTHLIYGPTSIETFISLCCFSYTNIVNYVTSVVTGLTLQFL
jgi:hypothetical protein